jgi:RNase adaptor protein for sRNA GlmZ degradation
MRYAIFPFYRPANRLRIMKTTKLNLCIHSFYYRDPFPLQADAVARVRLFADGLNAQL